jgi:HSP90 family molecular chaperone
MKVRTKYNKEVSSGGLGETRDFKIKASGEIFQMFSSTLYSNKPRAILRELGCNAYDSHVANGNQDKPFEVTLPTQWEPTLEIRDFGTGLSHEDMMELYSTYFESTKRDSNDYTGAFGIGSKSPFSYTDQFTVVSIFGGEKRTYIASLSDEGTPTLSSVGCVASSEPTGLAVRMAIGPNDMATFQGEALDVYSYFRTIPILKGAKEAVIKPEYTSQEKGLWG